jgi:hypothetical protein
MKKFEYQLHYFTSHEFPLTEQALNRLGEEGWELVSATPASADNYRQLRAIFKREKS